MVTQQALLHIGMIGMISLAHPNGRIWPILMDGIIGAFDGPMPSGCQPKHPSGHPVSLHVTGATLLFFQIYQPN